MSKFDVPVESILLNVLAKDGSSIGESHSALREYAEFHNPPSADGNGHRDDGTDWSELYPAHFANGSLPPPDLVVFGSGHNARIDQPDEVAVFEGAIRWFQRNYPDVEFVTAMWIRSPSDGLAQSMPELSDHYGIPFLDVGGMIQGLEESANRFSLAPDGGHPQAGAHYLWFKQLEKAFEVTSPLAEPLPQRHLPPRMNPYSYLWEGEMETVTTPSPRVVDESALIVQEGPLVIWAQDTGSDEPMGLRINGETFTRQAGRGRSHEQRSSRNASFIRGRMEPGDRYVIEVLGTQPAIRAFDEKTAVGKVQYGAGHPEWQSPVAAENFDSEWGHPYGSRLYRLHAGDTIRISGTGDVIAVDWLDQPEGGLFEASVNGETQWQQATDQPFTDIHGKSHWMENRRAIRDLSYGKHAVEIRVLKGSVDVIGVGFYPANRSAP